jgi:flagellar biosynthetic protein FliR
VPVISEAQLLDWLGEVLWPMFRIAGMLMVAPMFSAGSISARIRMLLALTLALAVHPLLPPPAEVPGFSLEGLLVGAQQVLIGVAAGFIMQLVFDAVVLGIQTAAMSMGLGFALFVDNKSGAQVPVLSQFHLLIALLIFLGLDGHILLIEMIIRSFSALPVGPLGFDREAAWAVAGYGAEMFAGAVRVALPAATAILIVNLSIGVISRAAPSLNLFAVGFPLTMLTGFAIMMISLPALSGTLVYMLERAFSAVQGLWG